jgi:hypothetical protein
MPDPAAPDAPVPENLPEDQSVLKAHYSLPSGRETFAVVAFDTEGDGVPVLPFTALEGIVFLRDVHGTLVNLANIHRIEGLPDDRPPLPMTGSV